VGFGRTTLLSAIDWQADRLRSQCNQGDTPCLLLHLTAQQNIIRSFGWLLVMRHALSYAACGMARIIRVAVLVKSFWLLLLQLSVQAQPRFRTLLWNPIAATTPELPEELPVSP
jgi:hypothetical protein